MTTTTQDQAGTSKPKPDSQAAKPSPAPAPRKVPHARVRPRHLGGLAGFAVIVALPLLLSGWYLWSRAHDRYVSYVGFSVRTEEVGSALELLGGVAELSGSSTSDTDILYKFIQSTEMVARVDAALDLRTIWSLPGTRWADGSADPVFAYNPERRVLGLFGRGDHTEPGVSARRGSIEDLTDYWRRMVGVYSDSGTGLIDLEVQAFTPQDAQAIAEAVFEESTRMINRLSAIAREDATRYANEELEKSVERLKAAREALTRFRNKTQIVDPSASIQGQMGLLTSLQTQLAETLIDLDILRQTSRESDPRIAQAERRVQVIEDRIAQERLKLGLGGDGEGGGEGVFANLVGEYERLAVDQQFAEQSYTAALATYDAAQAEAQRQSRYLAAHVAPTLPESATEPHRLELFGLIATFTFLIWATGVLVLYAIRDRR